MTQEIGGVITTQGNSILKDLSGSRQGFLPKSSRKINVYIVQPAIMFALITVLFGKKEKINAVESKCFLKELIINIAKVV